MSSALRSASGVEVLWLHCSSFDSCAKSVFHRMRVRTSSMVPIKAFAIQSTAVRLWDPDA
jgi:hypothetical protein